MVAPVVRRLDSAIHRINRYPVHSVVCFANTYMYPLDSSLYSWQFCFDLVTRQTIGKAARGMGKLLDGDLSGG